MQELALRVKAETDDSSHYEIAADSRAYHHHHHRRHHTKYCIAKKIRTVKNKFPVSFRLYLHDNDG